ncbi:helix-turn-helix transcriptional regulator [Pseudoduganella sp. RAF19]|uniref:helix-turn-helix transcriptional regulator n=1 Tax=Pseudoduganella sp. RAF19 TaxID=3233052 RepID=UPI003F968980
MPAASRHVGVAPSREEPTDTRPVTVVARELDAAEFTGAHAHTWGQFTYALEGVLRVSAANSSWIVPPLRAIWIEAGTMHEVTVLEAASMRLLCVDMARSPFARNLEVVEVSPLLRESIEALEQMGFGDESPRSRLLSELILDELPRSATRPIRVPLPSDKRLKTLCASLLNEPGSPQTLEHWARQVGASERTLARLFERELGLSFSQWRQQVRLAHAAPLIARGVPLSQVADQLGYASQSAFSAMFKKTFGSTPTAFFHKRA